MDPQRQLNLERAKSFDKIVSKESLMQHLKRDNPQKGRLNLLNVPRDSSNSNTGQTGGNGIVNGASIAATSENKSLGTLKLRKPIKPVVVAQQQGNTAIKGEINQKPMFDKKSPFNRLSLKKKNTVDEKNV